MSDSKLLSVQDLTVHYVTRTMGTCKAVRNVSLELNKGETIGLVGETGAGKTTVALSLMGLLPVPPAKIISGKIEFEGRNLLELKNSEMRGIRGKKISMIFQDPMTALNPIDRVGQQITEVIELHEGLSTRLAQERAMEMLNMVGIPKERFEEFPHQFSGGMKQRVVIAIALACNPELLIADEPTTALDVTIQAQVLDMMNELKERLGTSVVMITHDLGVVAGTCDKVAVMYAGEIVEIGDKYQVYKDTAHPYTKGLFAALPSLTSTVKRLTPIDGLMANPSKLPAGCAFASRCKYRTALCEKEAPPMVDLGGGHCVRCHLQAGEGKTVSVDSTERKA